MSQFNLYRNSDKSTSERYPFFVDVQSDFLEALNTRLVIPLTPISFLSGKAPNNLCPIFELPEGSYALLTHQMTSVPMNILNSPVGHLRAFRDEIIAAIDFVITGI